MDTKDKKIIELVRDRNDLVAMLQTAFVMHEKGLLVRNGCISATWMQEAEKLVERVSDNGTGREN